MRAFWDSSAIIPLCVPQQSPGSGRQLLESFSPVVWWGTPVEVAGAIARLLRGQLLTSRQGKAAGDRLALLREGWVEVQPTERLRALAEQLLRRHALRAADALQLAAALVWCNERPRGRAFLCRDQRLAEAARQENFELVGS